MRFIVLGLVIASFCYSELYAQSIRVSESASTRGHSSDQFLVAGHQVDISERGLDGSADASLSSVSAVSVIFEGNSVQLFGGAGASLNEVTYEAEPGDDSFKLYVEPNGGFIVRENIANFLFYGPDGGIKNTVSNSSQSTEGESVSELAADRMFKTVVLYNPKIISDGVEQSRARVIDERGVATNIFYDSQRAIKDVAVSEDGQFVAVVSVAQGSDDQVSIVDRFGNELGEFTFNQNIEDVTFSPDARFITIRSNSRVGIYSVISGEREGSTSFRNILQYAAYVPEDENIIAVTADRNGEVLSNVEFHAINLAARSIERQEYTGRIGNSDFFDISMERTARNTYTFSGWNKILNVSVRF
ncbi:MAG: hypothetical protein CL666_02990 [Balneola sp.]|nr:hypothetical protein [Balneola sp.]|tara:strand:+ start:1497 stop:2573 length:1077 start_codon:yes stop_codon:yes gene_type:complete